MLFVRIHFKYNANFKYIYKINIMYIKSKKSQKRNIMRSLIKRKLSLNSNTRKKQTSKQRKLMGNKRGKLIT